jgi:two-component system cell cycle response regulator DivK
VKRCVLVVEDNPVNAELLRDWLDVEGYEVWVATDLKTSYEALTKRLPDVVLLDINLGNESGLDLVTRMRQEPDTCEIPVIAVTAHALLIEQERILDVGCEACLSKPIDFAQLKTQLSRLL